MSQYVLSFRAPKVRPLDTEEEAAWGEWFQQIGAHVAEFGHRVGETSPLGNCGTDTVLGGYIVLTADNLDAAVTVAEGCPGLRQGGGVEVGTTVDMA